MDNYNLNMLGRFVIQKVQVLPIWKQTDIGRLIYVTSIDRYYIGANSPTVDDDGWAIIGLYSKSITNRHIDWDTNLDYTNDKISSINIPTLYADETTNVQSALDSIVENILSLSIGELIIDKAIIKRHIGFDASEINISHNNLYFSNNLSIEDILGTLYLKSAKDIKLSENSLFGKTLNLSQNQLIDLESSIITLEKYISVFPSTNIIIKNPIGNIDMSIQDFIDSFYGLIESKKFIDLTDTPDDYGQQNQFLITDGVRKIIYADLYAEMINIKFPGENISNIQLAINSLQIQIDNIALGNVDPITRDITTINASNVIYDDTTLTGLTNVDDILDYLLTHTYTISRPPSAINISSTGIGVTTNVQASLEHLQEYLNQAIGLIPTCLKASDIYYNSIKGHTNVDASLDYVFELTERIEFLEDCCDQNTKNLKKQKIYFSSYTIDSDFSPCGGFPISISFDFTTWYNDYKANYNPDVGNNFVVVPIMQINSFVVSNAYQKFKCSAWSNPDPTDTLFPGSCLDPIYTYPVHNDWPPAFTEINREHMEAGTLGEYSYVYYNAGPTEYLDEERKWSFSMKLGTRAYGYNKRNFAKTQNERNSEVERSYSTGGDISYTILFFGFGTDVNSLVKVLEVCCSTPCLYPSSCDSRSIPNTFKLTITFICDGSGTVSGLGNNFDFEVTKTTSYAFAPGSKIELSAVADEGSTFDSWSGDGTISTNKINVIMNVDKEVKAEFCSAVETFILTLHFVCDGSGTVTISATATATVTRSGSASTQPYSIEYVKGTIVTINATPGSGSEFKGWTGSITSSPQLITLTIEHDETIMANFCLPQVTTYSLTITFNCDGSGTVSGNGTDILPFSTTVNISYSFDAGQSIALSAAPSSGSKFVTWSGDATGSTSSISIVMNSNKTVMVDFCLNQTYTLTINFICDGSGSVSGSGSSISSFSTTSTKVYIFQANQVLNLTATASSGSSFTGWSGSLSGISVSASITMTSDKAISASFCSSIVTYPFLILFSCNGTGKVTVSGRDITSYIVMNSNSPSKTFNSGQILSLSAAPDSGSFFDGWGGDVISAANPVSVTITKSTNVTVDFCSSTSTFTLTITFSCDGQGTVYGSGTSISNFSTSSTIVYTFNSGQIVSLTASPSSGSTFDGWSGDVTSASSVTNITMSSNKNITVDFCLDADVTYEVNIVYTCDGGGTVRATGDVNFVTTTSNTYTVNENSNFTLTATPNAGSTFDGWGGDISGTTNPYTNIIVTSDKTIHVDFCLNTTVYKLCLFSTAPCPSYTNSIKAYYTIKVTIGGTVYTHIYDATHTESWAACEHTSLPPGTSVKIEIIPHTGSFFNGWRSDGYTGTDNPLTIIMDSDKELEYAVCKTPTCIEVSTGVPWDGCLIVDANGLGFNCYRNETFSPTYEDNICTVCVPIGTNLTLIATADTSRCQCVFEGWNTEAGHFPTNAVINGNRITFKVEIQDYYYVHPLFRYIG